MAKTLNYNILVGVPLGPDCQADFMANSYAAAWQGMSAKIKVTGKAAHETDYARNLLVADLLANPDYTHLLFLDADTRPPIEAIAKLLAHDKSIISGIVPMILSKQFCFSAALCDCWLEEIPKEGLFKASQVGAAILLVKREVFEKIEWPWFKCVFDKNGNRVGEDIFFCNKAKQAGFDLWCDPSVVCEHMQRRGLFAMYEAFRNSLIAPVPLLKTPIPKVSIIVPYIREKGVSRCHDAIELNAGNLDYQIHWGEDRTRMGVPKMIHLLASQAKYDYIMFLADDVIPRKNFLFHAIAAMQSLPDGWGLVGLNDGIHNGNELATHWMAHKKLLPLLGGEFFHTGYWHCYCDLELLERCKKLGRYVWAENAKIKHVHPAVTGIGWDDDYRRVYSDEWQKHDKELYESRKHLWE